MLGSFHVSHGVDLNPGEKEESAVGNLVGKRHLFLETSSEVP